MTLQFFDTASRTIRPFVPVQTGHVRLYQCGATVQSSPHIGHIRSGLVFDVLHRWLLHRGMSVTLVRNVTDIDDKILARAEAEDTDWFAVASRYEREFQWAYSELGCLPPTVEPRATGHVTQMVELISDLIDRGHAYAADGDVYFDVRSDQGYGMLSRHRLEDLQASADVDPDGKKRDPRDFALWKAARPGEPSWPTPWGRGRPGWHIECTAMAVAYLGDTFDIHGGGLDLVFPHHENELAQARAAGHGFAHYWLHNAWVTVAGEKMGKSLGNSLQVARILDDVEPIELRWYLIAAHYRSNLEYSPSALKESTASFGRIRGFLDRARDFPGSPHSSRSVPDSFSAAMDDDLGVPAAIAVIHDLVTEGNRALASGEADAICESASAVTSCLQVLGMDPKAAQWRRKESSAKAMDSLQRLVDAELSARQAARQARDFELADAIRDRISQAGLAIEDGGSGSRWRFADEG